MASSPDPSTPSASTGEGQGEGEGKPPPPNLVLRLLTAGVALPLIFAVIWFGGPVLSIAVTAIIVAAIIEFYALLSMRWWSPGALVGLALTALLLAIPIFRSGEVIEPMFAIASGVLCLAMLSLKRERRVSFFDPIMWGGVGAYVIAWPLTHFIVLRDLSEGRYWVFYVLVTVFAADTGAYFVGKAFGRRKLAPRISPNKTMEGAGGGIAAAVLLGTLAHNLMDLPGALHQIAALSCITSLVSMVGDLTESYLKRRVGAKESGRLLPGHGGILDRLDSVVFTLPLVYYYVKWLTD